MPEKTKRKANPRRRTLMRLIIGMGILIALITGVIQILRPSGAEIVYIAPDENNVEQVWLVNLNNPDNPRQLTEFDDSVGIYDLQTTENNDAIVFAKNNILYQIREHQILRYDDLCNESEACFGWKLHPDGERVTFLAGQGHTTAISSRQLRIFNLNSKAQQTIFRGSDEMLLRSHHWLSDTNIIRVQYLSAESEGFFDLDYLSNTNNFVEFEYCHLLSPDGTQCIFHRGANFTTYYPPQFIEVVEIISLTIHSFPTYENVSTTENNVIPEYTSFKEWHPNNRQVLVLYIKDGSKPIIELRLYDIETQNFNTLSSVSAAYMYTAFNVDGTQLIVGRFSTSHESQLVHFDLETGEETILPIAGHNPQWVNGGR